MTSSSAGITIRSGNKDIVLFDRTPLEPCCVKLVDALNRLPGITTTASCGCCCNWCRGVRYDAPYYVSFVIERPSDLLPLVLLLRRPSLQGWFVEALADRDCGWDEPVNRPYEVRLKLQYGAMNAAAAWEASEKLATAIRKVARQLTS